MNSMKFHHDTIITVACGYLFLPLNEMSPSPDNFTKAVAEAK
jgi:hypothetical protein